MIRVLLIDHSFGHSNSIRELLDVSDANDLIVDCVTTNPKIMKGLHSESYDVCILDSPLDNGIKLFAQVRSLNFTVPIVLVVSGSASLAVEAMRNGVDDCLIRDELNAAQIERTVCAVAERTRYRSLQRQRERRHLAFLDNAVEIVYTHDLEGNLTSINRAAERLSGYEERELLAMNIRQLVMPESREMMSSMIERARDAQTQVVEELEMCSKAELKLCVSLNVHPIQHQGQTVEIQGVARPLSLGKPVKTEVSHRSDATQPGFDFKIFALPDVAGSIASPRFSG